MEQTVTNVYVTFDLKLWPWPQSRVSETLALQGWTFLRRWACVWNISRIIRLRVQEIWSKHKFCSWIWTLTCYDIDLESSYELDLKAGCLKSWLCKLYQTRRQKGKHPFPTYLNFTSKDIEVIILAVIAVPLGMSHRDQESHVCQYLISANAFHFQTTNLKKK